MRAIERLANWAFEAKICPPDEEDCCENVSSTRGECVKCLLWAARKHTSGRKGIDWDRVKFYGKSDPEIAWELGVDRCSVLRERRKRGIPAHLKPGHPVKLTDWKGMENELGKISDRSIAKHLGCASETIRRRRRKLGIPPFKKEKKS